MRIPLSTAALFPAALFPAALFAASLITALHAPRAAVHAAPAAAAAPVHAAPAAAVHAEPAAAPGARDGVVVGYAAPVAGAVRVLRPFEPPAGPYGPGHRGVDLALGSGGSVLSAADGTVTFAATVAGRGVVVVLHADGIRTEYEPVRPSVRAGRTVHRGQALGVLTGRHAGCAGSCVHWGARRGEQYLDPMSLLRRLGPVRLLPWDE